MKSKRSARGKEGVLLIITFNKLWVSLLSDFIFCGAFGISY